MSQVGDFQWFSPTRHGVIEVKSLKHEYRLSKSSFSTNQLSKLGKRMEAGGHVWVLVHHWTTGVWRCVPFKDIRKALVTDLKPSVDLRPYTVCESAAHAMHNMFDLIYTDYD